MTYLVYLAIGLTAGFVGGALGLGGGAIMVPAMGLLLGLPQHQAQGTALAVMLPPIFVFAVLRYYYAGNVKVMIALWIAAGFILGALLGAHIAQGVPSPILRKAFGLFVIAIGIKMVF